MSEADYLRHARQQAASHRRGQRAPCRSFGKDGAVDLNEGIGQDAAGLCVHDVATDDRARGRGGAAIR